MPRDAVSLPASAHHHQPLKQQLITATDRLIKWTKTHVQLQRVETHAKKFLIGLQRQTTRHAWNMYHHFSYTCSGGLFYIRRCSLRYLEITQATFLKVLSLQHILFASRPRLVDIAFQLELRRQMIQAFQPKNRQSHFKLHLHLIRWVTDNIRRFIRTLHR